MVDIFALKKSVEGKKQSSVERRSFLKKQFENVLALGWPQCFLTQSETPLN